MARRAGRWALGGGTRIPGVDRTGPAWSHRTHSVVSERGAYKGKVPNLSDTY